MKEEKVSIAILYFGNVDMGQSRNKVYADGLRQNGLTVLECVDRALGLHKYWNLYKKHRALKGKYDVLVVGYTAYIMVPFARLISRKPVIFDALCSFYETEILSRDALKEMPFRIPFVRLVDWLATRCAHKVLVETEEQKKYFMRELGVPEHKLVVVYTGVDDTLFRADLSVPKYDTFTVLFRGRIMSEAGVPTVVRAAKLLEKEHINFLIIGHGVNDSMQEFRVVMSELSPTNIRHIGEQLPPEELVAYIQKCHVSLGQFARHERLERTIPHKCFEALAMKLPYITARTKGVSEILEEGKHCLMTKPGDAEDLARTIRQLRDSPGQGRAMAESCYTLYTDRFSPKMIVGPMLECIKTLS